MRIQTIRPAQFPAAIDVMARVGHELWGVTLDMIRKVDLLQDLGDIQGQYFDNRGTFLVIVNDNDEVVGTGGIHRMDEEICELKRLWLLKEYRGLGMGRQLTEALLQAARDLGYKRVRLEVSNPEIQQAAIGLYTDLGFLPIPQYHTNTSCTYFMEKVL